MKMDTISFCNNDQISISLPSFSLIKAKEEDFCLTTKATGDLGVICKTVKPVLIGYHNRIFWENKMILL